MLFTELYIVCLLSWVVHFCTLFFCNLFRQQLFHKLLFDAILPLHLQFLRVASFATAISFDCNEWTFLILFYGKRRAQNYWSNYPLDWSGMQRMQTFVFAWMVCWIQCTRTFWVAKTNVSNNKVNASFTSTNIHTHTHTHHERSAPCVMNMKKVAYTGTKRTLKIFTNFFLFLSIFVQTLHQHIYFILRFIKNYVAQFVLHKSLSESM